MGKKKKKPLPPRCKRMKRTARLQSARSWIPKYEGKSIVRGYKKHFGVDLLCAVKELEMLGYSFSEQYKESLKQNLEYRQKGHQMRKQLKEQQELESMYPCSDDRFYFIAGYTSGGAPYGITWEEMGMEPYENDEDEDDFI